MNNVRREQIYEVINRLQDLECEIEFIKDEEEECLDNIPDNLRSSETYQKAEEAVENLDIALEYISDLISFLDLSAI